MGIAVAANSGFLPRTGGITIAGQTLPLLQKSAIATPQFSDVPASNVFAEYISLLRTHNITNGCEGNAAQYCPDAVMTRAEMAAFLVRSVAGESFSYAPAPYFTDVPANHSHFAYIQKLKELGITTGCSATAYCPGQPVTRGQMAVFLIRARLGLTSADPFPYTTGPYFGDVGAQHMFFPYIQKLKELGITAGCSATGYCPDASNTRGQMAVFVIRGLF